MSGINIGLFGLTSTGKSTMVNALLGRNEAATGCGETTEEIKAYNGKGFTLWDTPGRIDADSDFMKEKKYILDNTGNKSFLNSLTRRVILIRATVEEMRWMMEHLDKLGLQYDIVFNKFDQVESEEEQTAVKKQIQDEIKETGLRGVRKVYFVSAKNPRMFDDWVDMVNHFIEGI